MVTIDTEQCVGCGKCAGDCITGCIAVQNGKAASSGPCILCGHCVAICPQAAVSIPEYGMDDVENCAESGPAFSMDSYLHTVKARRSIRHYKEKPVEHGKLEKLLQAGRYTATGSNAQDCRLVVVQEGLARFKDIIWEGLTALQTPADSVPPALFAALQNFVNMRQQQGIDYLFRNAPAVLFIAAESTVDAALAAQNMEMTALAGGLGILYNGFLKIAVSMNPAAREWLDLGDKPAQVCMLAGYPQITYQRTAPRRAADVRWK